MWYTVGAESSACASEGPRAESDEEHCPGSCVVVATGHGHSTFSGLAALPPLSQCLPASPVTCFSLPLLQPHDTLLLPSSDLQQQAPLTNIYLSTRRTKPRVIPHLCVAWQHFISPKMASAIVAFISLRQLIPILAPGGLMDQHLLSPFR